LDSIVSLLTIRSRNRVKSPLGSACWTANSAIHLPQHLTERFGSFIQQDPESEGRYRGPGQRRYRSLLHCLFHRRYQPVECLLRLSVRLLDLLGPSCVFERILCFLVRVAASWRSQIPISHLQKIWTTQDVPHCHCEG
jgi:hypothetical protein